MGYLNGHTTGWLFETASGGQLDDAGGAVSAMPLPTAGTPRPGSGPSSRTTPHFESRATGSNSSPP